MVEVEDNSNVIWKKGDKVDSVGGIFVNGEVLEVINVKGYITLKIKWPNGLMQIRSTRIIRKCI